MGRNPKKSSKKKSKSSGGGGGGSKKQGGSDDEWEEGLTTITGEEDDDEMMDDDEGDADPDRYVSLHEPKHSRSRTPHPPLMRRAYLLSHPHSTLGGTPFFSPFFWVFFSLVVSSSASHTRVVVAAPFGP